MQTEVSTISLIKQGTAIPVPQVHMYDASAACDVGGPFMLMDCLAGNVGMDLGMKVPTEHKNDFHDALADIQGGISKWLSMFKDVELIFLDVNEDGTCEQGPIPGLGGPFDTASEFFRAWSNKIEFGMSDERLGKAAGEYASEIRESVSSFRASIARLADRLSISDNGPFPLCHGDFGHNNVIVDDDYHVLGVIDWEFAFAAPWEIAGDFPLNLSIVPQLMDVPWNYDGQGNPLDAEMAERWREREMYVTKLDRKEHEQRDKASDFRISTML